MKAGALTTTLRRLYDGNIVYKYFWWVHTVNDKRKTILISYTADNRPISLPNRFFNKRKKQKKVIVQLIITFEAIDDKVHRRIR